MKYFYVKLSESISHLLNARIDLGHTLGVRAPSTSEASLRVAQSLP